MRLPDILQRVADHGHTVFETGTYNLNLIGVRVANKPVDSFGDWIVGAWKEPMRGWVLRWFSATTDPGLVTLHDPITTSGTAILAPGQYPGMFTLGKHKGTYDALIQAKPCSVWRDRNRDGTPDRVGPLDVGLFGINLHRAGAKGRTKAVGAYSAGCQVLADADEFSCLMEMARTTVTKYGSSITYTLIDG